jgi:hypothetical protein
VVELLVVDVLVWVELVVDAVELVVDAVELVVDAVELVVDAVELVVDAVELVVDAVELVLLVVDAVELVVDAVELVVDDVELVVDDVELVVDDVELVVDDVELVVDVLVWVELVVDAVELVLLVVDDVVVVVVEAAVRMLNRTTTFFRYAISSINTSKYSPRTSITITLYEFPPISGLNSYMAVDTPFTRKSLYCATGIHSHLRTSSVPASKASHWNIADPAYVGTVPTAFLYSGIVMESGSHVNIRSPIRITPSPRA